MQMVSDIKVQDGMVRIDFSEPLVALCCCSRRIVFGIALADAADVLFFRSTLAVAAAPSKVCLHSTWWRTLCSRALCGCRTPASLFKSLARTRLADGLFAVPLLCAVSACGGLAGLAFDFKNGSVLGVSLNLFAVPPLCAAATCGAASLKYPCPAAS